MSMKYLLKIGLIAAMAVSLTTVQAGPDRDKEKPEKPRPEKKIDREKIKERLKAAFEKRQKNHKDSKKKGHKLHHKGRAFGKLVRDDEKIKELREAFSTAAKEHHSKVKDLHKQLKDAADAEKDGLRNQLKSLRKDWVEGMKGNREEVRERLKDIRTEFKNKRDEVIDGNQPEE